MKVIRERRATEFFTYSLSYPQGCILRDGTDVSGIVFYVGKGCGNRVNQHLSEAKRGCGCKKCETIRFIWRKGLKVDTRIRQRTPDEQEALENERLLIIEHSSKYLMNVRFNLAYEAEIDSRPDTRYRTEQAAMYCRLPSRGTRFICLGYEYGLKKTVIDNVNYYYREDLDNFIVWLDKVHPEQKRHYTEG
jgi:hypothetical protein